MRFSSRTHKFVHVKSISEVGNVCILSSTLDRKTRRKELSDKKLNKQTNKAEFWKSFRTWDHLQDWTRKEETEGEKLL